MASDSIEQGSLRSPGMEQRHLGSAGLTVSRLGLGTMTWGRDTDEHEARDQLSAFCDAGGTLIDTADVYVDGAAERILGSLVGDVVPRPDVVIATKAASRPGTSRRFDGSRGYLLSALDSSLQRLGTDYVDLWQFHAWDASTPIDETLSAADAAVRSGRARYAGVSNYSGWQTAWACAWQSAFPGRAPLVASQMEYSLLQRGVEREVLPALEAAEAGLLAWSPLGRGALTGKYRTGTPSDSRAASEHFADFVRPFLDDRSRKIVDAVVTAAGGLGVAPLEVALAWVRDRPGVTSAIVGARTAAQLLGSLATESLELPEEIIVALDEVSAPSRSYPEHGWNQRRAVPGDGQQDQ
jgi:aryl-alcohol dehydrogenase-like predicted oxidoreductase